jgi:hypothetical protein
MHDFYILKGHVLVLAPMMDYLQTKLLKLQPCFCTLGITMAKHSKSFPGKCAPKVEKLKKIKERIIKQELKTSTDVKKPGNGLNRKYSDHLFIAPLIIVSI